MRVFQVVGDQKFNEVAFGEHPKRGLMDIMLFVKNTSASGQYVIDYENGSYHEIVFSEGVPQGFDPREDLHIVAQDEAPGYQYDAAQPKREYTQASLQPEDGVYNEYWGDKYSREYAENPEQSE